MADVYKRKSNGPWWGRFRSGGREFRRSLRTTSKAEAKKRLALWQAQEEAKTHFGEGKPYTWDEALERYINEVMPHNVSENTAKRYLVSFRQVHSFLTKRRLCDVGNDLVMAIALRPGPSPATRRRDLSAVSQVFRAATAWGWCTNNPIRTIDHAVIVKERRDPIVLPSETEIKTFIKRCPAPLDCMARFLLYSGVRLDEAASLRWPDITFNNEQPFADVVGKGNKRRTVPLSELAIAALNDCPRHIMSDFVFWHANGKRYTQASTRLAEIRRSLGITWKTHDLRHKFAVDYLKGGGSVYRLQQILGHSSISVTEMYLAHIPPEMAERAKQGVG